MARKESDRNKGKKGRAGKSARKFHLMVAVVLAAILGLGAYQWMRPGLTDGEGKSWHVMGGEHRPVLDPYQFGSPFVRTQYMAAQKHGAAMDQVFCYCNCDQPPFFHKSLLSCFTERHGAG